MLSQWNRWKKKDSTFVSQKYIHNIFSLQNNNKHVKYKLFPKDFDISEEKNVCSTLALILNIMHCTCSQNVKIKMNKFHI